MSDLEELTEEEKQSILDLYPPFVAKKLIELTDEINNRKRKNVTEFIQLIRSIWKLSSKSYQKEYWNKHGQWGDNYSETMETFLGDCRAVLDTSDYAVEMTPKQREMLQKFYDMMEDYEADPNAVSDPGYGVNDAAIIEDPLFAKCREYAKLVYEELSGDDLEAWEKATEKKS